MEVNFSIDFILGNCGEKFHKKCRRTHLDGEAVNGKTTPEERGSYAVKWRPLSIAGPHTQHRLQDHFESANTKCSPCSFAQQPNFDSSAARLSADAGTASCKIFSSNKSKSFVSDNPHDSYFESLPYYERHSPKHLPSWQHSYFPARPLISEISDPDKTLQPDNPVEKIRPKSRGSRVGRRLFTGLQLLELEKTFSLKPYLSRAERVTLAEKIKLTEGQIKTWFQNRRTKEKRRGPNSDDDRKGHDEANELLQQPVRIHAHGIQVRATYGPSDQYLLAAVADYLKRRELKAASTS